MPQAIQLAVVGATTLVGQEVLELLALRKVPLARVFALDVMEQAGETATFGNLELNIQAVETFDFEQVSIAVFAAGSEVAREFVPQAQAAGVVVVDFSGAYRRDESIPLLLPALLDEPITPLEEGALVAVPDCTVAPLAQVLAPLRALGLSRVSVATYQAVSGSGKAAMEELAGQTTALFSHKDAETEVYAKRIAFNVLPQIGELDIDGHSSEENALRYETRRLLDLPDLAMEVTCARVPVFFGHSWAVTVQLAAGVTLKQVAECLQVTGVQIIGRDQHGGYITPMEAIGNDGIWLSRLRQQEQSFSFWISADNVRVGAALNCVRIVEAHCTSLLS